MSDAPSQERVGEHCQAVQFDPDGSVAYIRNSAHDPSMLTEWQTGRPHVGGWLWPGRSSSWASCSQWSPWSPATSATRRSTPKRFGNTSEELIADPVIRDQIATTLVEQLYGNVDVEAELERRLPPTSKGSPGHWPRRPASSVTERRTGFSSDHAHKSSG